MNLRDALRGVPVPMPADLVDGRVQLRAQTKPVSMVVPSGTARRSLVPAHAREFSASAWAYRCVQAIASQAAGVPLAVRRPNGELDPDHPVAQLWNRRPNDGTVVSAAMLKLVLWQQLELAGEAFVYCDRGEAGTGDPRGLWPVYDPVEVVVDRRIGGQLVGYVVRPPGGARPVPLLPGELVWLRYPHPFDPWAALAPWKAALYATEIDAEARAWQLGEFRNGARPSHVVYLGELDDAGHEAAVAEWRANVEGPGNAGRSLLLSSRQGMGDGESPPTPSVSRLTLTPAEMSYLESRARNAEEVMAAFGVPKDYLLGGATYENRRASKTTLWSDTIVPKLELVASQVDLQLLPADAEAAEWDLSGVEALREGQDAQSQRVVAQTTADLLLLDEARDDLGLEPLPGGLGQQTLTAYRQSLGGPAPPLRMHTRRTPRQLARPRVVAFYDRHEAIGARVWRRLADKQQRVTLRNLERLAGRGMPALLHPDVAQRWRPATEVARMGADPWTVLPVPVWPGAEQRVSADGIFDSALWRAQTEEATEAWMAGVWEGGAAQVAEGLGIDFSRFDSRVLVAMDTRRQVLAHMVTETTRRVLDAQLLQAGVEGGESIPELAARIRAVFEDLRTWRATTIARTETVGGFNAASRIAAVESGVVTGRTWLATDDARTRDDHLAINGETVAGLTARYSNGLLHPGEPGAPPEQVINCRCVETFQVED